MIGSCRSKTAVGKSSDQQTVGACGMPYHAVLGKAAAVLGKVAAAHVSSAAHASSVAAAGHYKASTEARNHCDAHSVACGAYCVRSC